MKYFFILFFFTLLSCGPGKKVFICGDRPCIDKKEFDKYFVENFIIEIQPDKKKKEKTIDLVKLNTFYKEKKNSNKKNSNLANNKLNKKEERAILKAQKVRLKNERKLDKIKRRNKIKEEKTLAKLNKKRSSKKIKTTAKNIDKKKIINKNNVLKKTKVISNIGNTANKNLCEDIKDCDIDKIADLLIKKGKEKKFPSINDK